MTNHILPAVRAHIARELIEKHGFSQVSAADKLGLTQSAMSRYLTSDRGSRTQLSVEVVRSIERIADDLAGRESPSALTVEETCRICLSMRRSGDFCRLHRDLDRGIPDSCNACIRIFEAEDLHI
jgi:hypothetical protein